MAPPKLPPINMDRVNNPPPAPPQHAATARSASCHQRQVDMGLLKATGKQGSSLNQDDVARNPELHEQFKSYSLRDYFDQDGRRRFQNLSLTYAARHQKNLKMQFGSTSDAHLKPAHLEHASFSARAYHLATQAIERDKELIESRAKEATEALTSEDKVRSQDVLNRQTEFLFLEVPDYQKYLPPGVTLEAIVPPDLGHEEETKQKWKDDRNNSSLDQLLEASNLAAASIRHEWMLSVADIAELMKWLQLWNTAARGYNAPMGMCRPTFCQFLFDAGLVGTKEVPYHWAVSLFDAQANPSRCCPAEASWAPTAPFTKSVNRWNLVGIIDRIIRQYCDKNTKSTFFRELIGKLREKIPSKYCEPRDIKKVTGLAATSARGSSLSARRSSQTEEDDDDQADEGMKASKRGSVVSAASAVSSQPWLKPPERPVSSVDTGREHLKRDRLVSSMLMEPDVLHMMMKYKPLFTSLFDCYAKEGKMAFPEFLQFAVNFRIMPRVASTYVLQYMYDSVVCLDDKEIVEYRKQKKEKKLLQDDIVSPKSARGSMGKERRARSTRKGNNRLSVSTSHRSNNQMANGEATPSGPPRKTSNGELHSPRTPGLKRKGTGTSNISNEDGRVESASSGQSSAISTQCPDSKMSSSKRESNKSASSLSVSTTERLSVEEEPISEDAAPKSNDDEYDLIEVRRVEQVFGVNSFMEAIFKVSFSYLAYYGNSTQANSSSFAKAVWVVTYIHCMYDHFQQSRTRHSAEAENQSDSSKATPSNFGRLQKGSKQKRGSRCGPDSMMPNGEQSNPFAPTTGVQPGNPFAPKTEEKLENNVNKGMEQNLKKVLDQVDSQLFTQLPRCELEFTFPNLEPRPGPGMENDELKNSLKNGLNGIDVRKGVQRKRRRATEGGEEVGNSLGNSELASPAAVDKRPDYEEPAVAHGHCRVCDTTLLANDWGNPLCHGCSAVDSVGLHAMPIHKLLQLPGENGDSTKKDVEKKLEEYKQPVLEVRLPAGVRPLALNMNMQLSPPPTGEIRQLLFLS
eukprot:gnl/MRDRNA2_/MRDRNA2_114082_c0_seq1.p1 gnl/MRDRNA2_/MRDRNA2_114082_c0~~gnl/MRDRNA2_/MRDRNA2_114082_c0_seq1.p1  ORF type:complete len:1025 (-),score=181.47 gnl/MRDRNA2_/MRDRNA2_114082_c0_seq1:152-3226(-)